MLHSLFIFLIFSFEFNEATNQFAFLQPLNHFPAPRIKTSAFFFLYEESIRWIHTEVVIVQRHSPSLYSRTFGSILAGFSNAIICGCFQLCRTLPSSLNMMGTLFTFIFHYIFSFLVKLRYFFQHSLFFFIEVHLR